VPFVLFCFFERVEGGVRASPNTAWASIQIACKSVRAAVGKDTWGLVRHHIWRVNDLGLQSNFLVDVLAILYLQCFPNFISH
jgi:hypothetical protein